MKLYRDSEGFNYVLSDDNVKIYIDPETYVIEEGEDGAMYISDISNQWQYFYMPEQMARTTRHPAHNRPAPVEHRRGTNHAGYGGVIREDNRLTNTHGGVQVGRSHAEVVEDRTAPRRHRVGGTRHSNLSDISPQPERGHLNQSSRMPTHQPRPSEVWEDDSSMRGPVVQEKKKPAPVVTEPKPVKKVTAMDYLLRHLKSNPVVPVGETPTKGEVAKFMKYARLSLSELITTIDTLIKNHPKGDNMNKTSHAALYNSAPVGTGEEDLETLEEISVVLHRKEKVEHPDISVDMRLCRGSIHLSKTPELQFDLKGHDFQELVNTLNAAYAINCPIETKMEIRSMDRYLTMVSNIYLKAVCSSAVVLDSIFKEYAEFKRYVVDDECVTGVDAEALGRLRAFLLDILNVGGIDNDPNIVREKEVLGYINKYHIVLDTTAEEYGIKHSGKALSKPKSGIMLTKVNAEQLLMVLNDSHEGEKTGPVFQTLSFSDCEFTCVKGDENTWFLSEELV